LRDRADAFPTTSTCSLFSHTRKRRRQQAPSPALWQLCTLLKLLCRLHTQTTSCTPVSARSLRWLTTSRVVHLPATRHLMQTHMHGNLLSLASHHSQQPVSRSHRLTGGHHHPTAVWPQTSPERWLSCTTPFHHLHATPAPARRGAGGTDFRTAASSFSLLLTQGPTMIEAKAARRQLQLKQHHLRLPQQSLLHQRQ